MHQELGRGKYYDPRRNLDHFWATKFGPVHLRTSKVLVKFGKGNLQVSTHVIS